MHVLYLLVRTFNCGPLCCMYLVYVSVLLVAADVMYCFGFVLLWLVSMYGVVRCVLLHYHHFAPRLYFYFFFTLPSSISLLSVFASTAIIFQYLTVLPVPLFWCCLRCFAFQLSNARLSCLDFRNKHVIDGRWYSICRHFINFYSYYLQHIKDLHCDMVQQSTVLQTLWTVWKICMKLRSS